MRTKAHDMALAAYNLATRAATENRSAAAIERAAALHRQAVEDAQINYNRAMAEALHAYDKARGAL